MTAETQGQDLAIVLMGFAEQHERVPRWRQVARRWADLEASSIPRRALLVTVSGNVERDDAIGWADHWVDEKCPGLLVFSGPVGTGKTVAAAWYASRTKARWLTAAMMGLASPARAHAMLEDLLEVPALVIDDIGAQGTTAPQAVERIATLIAGRHAAMRPTVITTNFDEKDFAERYDGVASSGQSRLFDRVREDGAWVPVVRTSRRTEDLDLSRLKVDTAREAVSLLLHAEAVSRGDAADEAKLARLQEVLEVTDEQVDAEHERLMGARVDFGSMVEGMLGSFKPPGGPATREEIAESDAEARARLHRQREDLERERDRSDRLDRMRGIVDRAHAGDDDVKV